jgi:hypothetical protein
VHARASAAAIQRPIDGEGGVEEVISGPTRADTPTVFCGDTARGGLIPATRATTAAVISTNSADQLATNLEMHEVPDGQTRQRRGGKAYRLAKQVRHGDPLSKGINIKPFH